MPISCTTPEDSIAEYIRQQAERMQRALIRTLQYVGERCLAQARTAGAYRDRTGNLRSSLGYIVVCDGKVMSRSSAPVVLQGADGAARGRAYARRLARQFPTGFALVVTAGMDYASFVADRGLDVLDSAELLADRLVPQLLRDLGLQ